MERSHFLPAGRGFVLCLCGVIVLGCGGGREPKPAGKPTTPPAMARELPEKPWKPPTLKDIPPDLDPAVRSLIKRTFSKEWSERANAAKELGALGDQAAPAVPFLLRLLGDNEQVVVVFPPEERVAHLPAPAGSEAWTALSRLGKCAVPGLIAALGADDVLTKEIAFSLLEDSGDPRATERIMRALHDEDEEFRHLAVCAVGKLRENRAVETLIEFLHDPSDDTVSDAAHALGRITDTRAVERLIELLHQPSDDIASEAARALGSIEDTRAVTPLIALLEDSKRNTQPRTAAAASLAQIADPRASEPLWERSNDPREDLDIRAAAANSLGGLKDPRAFELLKAFVRNKEDTVRGEAIAGLGRLADDRSVKLLIDLLEGEEQHQKRPQIALALVRTDKPTAIDAVIAAPDVFVWKSAVGTEQEEVFSEKVYLLALSSNPRAYLWAIDALGHEDQGVRFDVLEVLASGRPSSQVWEFLIDSPPDGRAPALKDPRIIEPLIAIAKDPKADDRMRENAITALRETEAPEALKFLESIEGQKAPAPHTEPDY